MRPLLFKKQNQGDRDRWAALSTPSIRNLFEGCEYTTKDFVGSKTTQKGVGDFDPFAPTMCVASDEDHKGPSP